MVALSILIIFLAILVVINAFLQIKEHQETRTIEFEEANQLDQIDYLIGILDWQEKFLKRDPRGMSAEDVERGSRLYLDLTEEFSDQLNNLHEMIMVGVSKKFDDELLTKGKKKKDDAFESYLHLKLYASIYSSATEYAAQKIASI
eukprot:CAMPEP_0172544368 /NCGR_PEP_ID=MMETSP1067-20121228/14543_1 /TAXON_ID=265564 ORGANISM="Thalassiosira punctigera, Strain Tpunct2005C2" /NCGR_SAMPLE_ID=MMETSP1067 /ASSEMBLY_ACC=CAM_ASM_000444 /LENGTH=145 /DNA_ID=CAMNT_0013330919 /DNA_START=290 /DNA_END=727 /DNA_ORIENTATION=-